MKKVGNGRPSKTGDAELLKVLKAARRRERGATKINVVRYDSHSDAIVLELSTRAVLTIPRRRIVGFARATRRQLTDVSVTPGGEGIWSEAVDDGALLEQLLMLAAGEATLGTIGARINASRKTPARAAASRANGAKGGRPPKTAA